VIKIPGQTELKQIAEIMHTIFCGQEHEQDMLRLEDASLCTFYLENNIDTTWEMEAHQEWLAQARFLVQVSEPLSAKDILQDMIKVYHIAEHFKTINPRLLEFVRIIIA